MIGLLPSRLALAFFSGSAVVGVEAGTGRTLWTLPWKTLWDLNAADPTIHEGKMFVADGKLLLLSETGKLVVAEPSGDAFKPLASAQVLDGRCWTTPVLSGGRIYVRNAAGDVVCMDARGR